MRPDAEKGERRRERGKEGGCWVGGGGCRGGGGGRGRARVCPGDSPKDRSAVLHLIKALTCPQIELRFGANEFRGWWPDECRFGLGVGLVARGRAGRGGPT